MTMDEAAHAVGMSAPGVRLYKSKHEDFAIQCQLAPAMGNIKVQLSLYQQAIKGNIRAIEIWVFNKMSEHWKYMKSAGARAGIAVNTEDGGQVTFNIITDDGMKHQAVFGAQTPVVEAIQVQTAETDSAVE